MKVKLDKKADALYITFKEGEIYNTIPQGDYCIVDVDKKGDILGLEILNYSKIFSAKEISPATH
jgi:uncharacterized protein YuzE